mmetsp:Transcript_17546/g.40869  ORF Transcript_17546/g.40869 Transcript_17546/m.40869 type:complete len:548 (+) Transcript_17546:418-2061(+)
MTAAQQQQEQQQDDDHEDESPNRKTATHNNNNSSNNNSTNSQSPPRKKQRRRGESDDDNTTSTTTNLHKNPLVAQNHDGSDSKHDQRWMERFQDLVEFKKIHGHCNVPTQRNKDTPTKVPDRWFRLSSWVSTQRTQHKLLRLGKWTTLKPERVRQLTAIGFSWSGQPPQTVNLPFDRRLEQLQAYRREHGHVNVPQKCSDPQYSGLGNFCLQQRKDYRQGTLATDRRERLERLGFQWSLRNRGGPLEERMKKAQEQQQRQQRQREQQRQRQQEEQPRNNPNGTLNLERNENADNSVEEPQPLRGSTVAATASPAWAMEHLQRQQQQQQSQLPQLQQPLQQQQQQQQRHPQRLDREQPSSPAPTKPTLACETFESSPHDDDDDDHDGEPQKLLYQSKPADVVREEPIPQWIKWITVVSLCLLCSAVIMITLALLLSGNGETDNNPTTSEASNGNLDNNPSMLLPTFPPSMAPSSPRRPTLRPTTTLGNDQQSLPTATTASPTSAPTSRSPSLAPISRSPTLSPASGAPTLSPTREGPTKGKDSKRNED